MNIEEVCELLDRAIELRKQIFNEEGIVKSTEHLSEYFEILDIVIKVSQYQIRLITDCKQRQSNSLGLITPLSETYKNERKENV